jgi:hypothetical protein
MTRAKQDLLEKNSFVGVYKKKKFTMMVVQTRKVRCVRVCVEEVEKALLEPVTTILAPTTTFIKATMYWESKEAQAIFQLSERESSVLKAINNQIELLKQVVLSHHLMPSIIDGDFEDITKYKEIAIRKKVPHT